MTRDEYEAVLRWFRGKGAQFVQSSKDGQWPATWFLQDGGTITLPTVEACGSLDEVRSLVLGEVMA